MNVPLAGSRFWQGTAQPSPLHLPFILRLRQLSLVTSMVAPASVNAPNS
nr:hypothetical protein [Ktedonobacteraceae bacterium]